MKKILKYTPLLLLVFPIAFIIQNYPVSSEPKQLNRLSDTLRIRRNLEMIVNTDKHRMYRNIAVLDTVAERIKNGFSRFSKDVNYQNYIVEGREYKNVIASFGPKDAERIIIGAHYDVCYNQDGADDNASGVAGLLELAALLKSDALNYRIDLVAYTLEEPPYFNTEQMGSYVHAKYLKDNAIPVLGMISLEMIGYYSEEEDSQDYPFGVLKWIYGNKGNYITIVQKTMSDDFSRRFKDYYFENNSIIAKGFRAPSGMGGIDLSDHLNYWKLGYSALMVTNTAFFRNHNYHHNTDKLSTLNVPQMGLAIDGVYRTIIEMQSNM